MEDTLTDRQRREVEYHRQHAIRHQNRAEQPVDLDVVQSDSRRWWNAYWHTYTILRRLDLKQKRVLLPGCGFGDDAVRLASMGAQVHACDISPDIIMLAKERAKKFDYLGIEFQVMSAEDLEFEDNTFDYVFFRDILHHVDISATMKEVKRVLKHGGNIVGDELYTHSFIQNNIRKNPIVDKIIYNKMVKFIYGTENPYITEDEHKIDEEEFGIITNACSDIRVDYFNMFVGRLVPDRSRFLGRVDRLLTRSLGSAARYLVGRVVFEGTIQA